jgi:hypothetical protein
MWPRNYWEDPNPWGLDAPEDDEPEDESPEEWEPTEDDLERYRERRRQTA